MLLSTFWRKIVITWVLTLLETGLFALMPLLIGWSIDGLLADDWTSFQHLIMVLFSLLLVATIRRAYDTRTFGTVRVELGKAQVARSTKEPVSITNARVLMGRELVDFLEQTAPESMTALVQVIVSVVILFSFHQILALSTLGATVVMLIIYGIFSKRFFKLNAALNERAESQIASIQGKDVKRIAGHFIGLRRDEVRLSDTETIVYGLIFMVLLSVLAFNLWFGATQAQASPGEIFSIVSYSLEFLQAAVGLPFALQSLTRLSEITQRINRATKEVISQEPHE
jgi:hypothetical protein